MKDVNISKKQRCSPCQNKKFDREVKGQGGGRKLKNQSP